jgi:hypothetical protein
MDGIVAKTARLWATIIVAWALLLNALVPIAAHGHPVGDAGVICTLAGPGAPPAGHAPGERDPGHGDLCCILCPAAAAAALPAPAPALPARIPAVAIAAPADRETAAPRGPPALGPIHPRAPPIVA